MSWLYSIIFAGLLFSGSDAPLTQRNIDMPLPAAAAGVQGTDETEKFEQTYSLNATGRVSVSNVNGSIVVEAWDRNEVRLEATKIADSKESLAMVEIEVESRPDLLSVEANYENWKRERDGDWKQRKVEVHFKLMVPRTAVLNEIETVNGSVTVSNFANLTKVSAVNGNVTATNLRGAASLSTVNGEVAADFDQLDSGSRITLSTVNGRVNLIIPSDANATIKADSLNGSIANDFGLPVRKGQYVGRDLHGRIGSGDVQIKLDSVNGGLAIRRKNDGRTPNPATNLLQQKADETDWEDPREVSQAIDAEAVRRAAAKAAKVRAHSAESLSETRKVLQKVKPELAKIDPIELRDLKNVIAVIDKEKLETAVKAGLIKERAVLARVNANWVFGSPLIEKRRNTFPVKGVPTVTVDSKGCSVRIRGWDRQEVKYVVTEVAGRRSRSPLNVTEHNTDSTVDLQIRNDSESAPGFLNESERVRIEIYVPRKSNMKITSDEEIRLDGVSGDIELIGAQNAINVRDVEGTLDVRASEGQVRIIGFKGDLNTRTESSDVFLEGYFNSLSANGGDGVITLTVPSDAGVQLSSNTLVESDGVLLTRRDDQTWILGDGGREFKFQFADGKLLVRNADSLLSTY